MAIANGDGITPEEATDTPFCVEGEWTFSATGGAAGAGYRLSVPDGNGGWTAYGAFSEGLSFTYDDTMPKTVKLTWGARNPFVIVVR